MSESRPGLEEALHVARYNLERTIKTLLEKSSD